MTLETYLLFISASFLLWITPGQDTIYIITRSISQGKLSGIVSALGIGTGALGHVFLASTGVSFIILTSPMLFLTIKILGGVYLIYLGITSVLSKPQNIENFHVEHDTLSKIYRKGILVNILNPKVALFFIAFLPQFLDTQTDTYSIILLGLTFVIGGTIYCIFVALFASSFSLKLRENKSIKSYFDKISGLVYITLGLKVLLAKV